MQLFTTTITLKKKSNRETLSLSFSLSQNCSSLQHIKTATKFKYYKSSLPVVSAMYVEIFTKMLP